MQQSMPALPLGTSTFETLRESNEIYVDKTDLVYKLAATGRGKIFLARPRRFGKSLLVSTFESLFAYGLRDFRGLAIEKRWTDKTYPVVRLDFSKLKAQTSTEAFEKVFCDYLQESDDERVRKLMKQRDQMHIKIAVAKNRQGQTGEVDAIFDKQFQNFVTQSVEKARTEKFDEFFAKYYSNTRSGRDLYWPMRQDDVPTALQSFRNAGIVENDYIADGKFIPRDSGHSSSQRMQLRQQYDSVPLEAYDGYAMDNGNVFSSVCDDDARERTESKANRIIDDAIHGGDTTKHDDKCVTATDSGNGAQPAADARQSRSEARTDASVDDGYWFTDDDADGYEDVYDEPMTDEDIDAAFSGDDELPPWAGGSGSTDDMADAMSSDDAVDDDDDEISRLLNDADSMLSAMGVDNVDDDDLDIDLDELDVFNS